jgi:acyl-CoA thioester hydrolase
MRVLAPVRWSDMDAYGHVNNVQFLRLMEEARIQVLSVPGAEGEPTMLESGIVVARAEIEYLRPMTYRPEPVAIDLWVTDLGGAGFDIAYVFTDGSTGEPSNEPDGGPEVVYARAETTLVPYDLRTNRPRRLTTGERAHLEALRGPAQNWRRRPKRGSGA